MIRYLIRKLSNIKTDINGLLKGDGSGVVEAIAGTDYVATDDSRLSDSRPPTGGAGGVLSGSYPIAGFAVDMATQSELNAHTGDTDNPHGVTASQVGLGNVDNTADADKPISTATQAALDGKLAKASNLSDLTDASAARTNLGVEIGTDVEAYNGNLAAIAGLTSAADKLPYFTGSGTAALADFTSFGRSLAALADASAGRTLLELGTMAVEDADDYAALSGAEFTGPAV